MKTLNMISKTETARGTYISSLFSNQFFGGHDLVVNVKQRRLVSPDGDVIIKTDVVVMLKDLDQPSGTGMLNTPFGVVCLWCKTSDYIKNDYFNKQYVGCTCTRCGTGTLA